MKTITIKYELTNEQYAEVKAISKINDLSQHNVLLLGIEGLINPLLDAEVDDDADEETLAQAKIYRKEYNRVMKMLSKK